MNKKNLLLLLCTLFVATLAGAKAANVNTNKFWFTVLTPSPSYTVISQSSTATWIYPPSCSQNKCTFSNTTDGNPYKFYVTIGKDSQHYCQLMFNTSMNIDTGQTINVLGSSNCVGNMNYKVTFNDGYNLNVMLFGPFNNK